MSSRSSQSRIGCVVGLISIITAVIVIDCIALGFIFFTFHRYIVNGSAMEPGLRQGQIVITSSLPYLFGNPKRGDLVILHPPISNNCQFSQANDIILKRIIGIPGDTVSLTPNSVILNGKVLYEPFILSVGSGETESVAIPTTTLGPAQYFVLGDNRQAGLDSRCFGPVPCQNILGKVLIA